MAPRRVAVGLLLGALLMASQIADIRNKVVARIQDDAGKLSTTALTGDVDRAITAAVARYSQDRPREVVVTEAGDGGFDYLMTTFGEAKSGATASTQWAEGFSSLLELVVPYDATDQGYTPLDADDYEVVRLPDGPTLRLLTDEPTASETMLLRYTRPHDLDEDLSTVPAADDEALADLAAAYCCEQLSGFYNQSTDSSFGADTANHLSKSAEYRALARRYADRYDAKMGHGDGAPAGVHVEIDRTFSDRAGTDYLYHGRRRF